MKLRIEEITEETREYAFAMPVEEIAATLVGANPPEFAPSRELAVTASCYRADQGLFVSGAVRGEFAGSCSRCLGAVASMVEVEFQTILLPQEMADDRKTELGANDLTLAYYSGKELDLGALCLEQALLDLPTRALCSAQCRGLCGSCGSNLNEETCTCTRESLDPRFAVLRELKVKASSREGRSTEKT
ncbi:MAG: DUF177 domain-containing protein [Deltaproteobacteria bacterium]